MTHPDVLVADPSNREGILLPDDFDFGDLSLPNGRAYNGTPPFADLDLNGNEREIRLVRYEPHDSEMSNVLVVDAASGVRVEDAPVFGHRQDPYDLGLVPDGTGGMWHIIGAVRILKADECGRVTRWQDEFFPYRDSISELGSEPVPFAHGVLNWKDTRFAVLPNGRLGILARPQGEEYGGLGSIAYLETDSLETLEADLEAFAARKDKSAILNLFAEGTWGGVNQILPRPDGSWTVLAHEAWRGADGKRNYRAVCFWFNPATGEYGPLKPLAEASNFPFVAPKCEDHGGIFFPAGVTLDEATGDHILHGAVGDERLCVIRIGNIAWQATQAAEQTTVQPAQSTGGFVFQPA